MVLIPYCKGNINQHSVELVVPVQKYVGKSHLNKTYDAFETPGIELSWDVYEDACKDMQRNANKVSFKENKILSAEKVNFSRREKKDLFADEVTIDILVEVEGFLYKKK